MSPAQLPAGRPAYMDAVQHALLSTAVRQSTPRMHDIHTSRWTGPAVRWYLQREFGIRMTIRHCQRLLKQIRESKF